MWSNEYRDPELFHRLTIPFEQSLVRRVGSYMHIMFETRPPLALSVGK